MKRQGSLRDGIWKDLRVQLLSLVAMTLMITGCSSVPKQTVELSSTVGADLQVLQTSYRKLIRQYFDSLRADVNSAIDRVFVPAYVNSFVRSGKLVQHAKNQRADLVVVWATIAVETIEAERKVRIAPLEKAETELVQHVDESFDRTIRANSAITAYLKSLVDVSDAQDEVLESLDLKDLRNKVNESLSKASDLAGDIRTKIDDKAKKLESL